MLTWRVNRKVSAPAASFSWKNTAAETVILHNGHLVHKSRRVFLCWMKTVSGWQHKGKVLHGKHQCDSHLFFSLSQIHEPLLLACPSLRAIYFCIQQNATQTFLQGHTQDSNVFFSNWMLPHTRTHTRWNLRHFKTPAFVYTLFSISVMYNYSVKKIKCLQSQIAKMILNILFSRLIHTKLNQKTSRQIRKLETMKWSINHLINL